MSDVRRVLGHKPIPHNNKPYVEDALSHTDEPGYQKKAVAHQTFSGVLAVPLFIQAKTRPLYL